KLREDVELLHGAGAAFNLSDFLNGTLTPVFFGSALNNFAIDPFLEALIQLAPPPRPRESRNGIVEPTSDTFSGIVFKIQANMDPQHRDSMAFLRVCSGRFEKDMAVHHARLGRKVKITRPHRLFARDRETLDLAFPGDVIGLSNPGIFAIGDTVSAGDIVEYAPIPHFQPECFAILRNASIEKHKQFHKGLEQLQQEGVVQVFQGLGHARSEPILGAVGKLQFDVVVARLAAEYNVAVTIQHLSYVTACWIEGDELEIKKVRWSFQSLRAFDRENRHLVLLESTWELRFQVKEYPDLRFVDIAGNPLAVAT
ncbi:MAG: peptide chain release factor 3, partial [Chloroflexi bacterium]|nr:peptide chain release factor 3 [Chloroflexota bacterium]